MFPTSLFKLLNYMNLSCCEQAHGQNNIIYLGIDKPEFLEYKIFVKR